MFKKNDPNRMLFLYRGWNSGTNQAVLQAWRSGSPELDIKEHNVCVLTEKTLMTRLMALPVALRRGGIGVFALGTGNFTDAAKRSIWYMKAVGEKVRKFQRKQDYDFSFSMSTVLPVITPPRPNFIYTDLTILANHYYPGGCDWVDLWREYLPYERKTIQSASIVFTMSDHVSQSLIEQYGLPPERVCRVNGGCNAPPILNPAPNRFAAQRILFIGVDWERKGGPELVEAFHRVQKNYPQATLTIVGCCPRGVAGPGITIRGFVPQTAVPEFLAQSTVFCMPSKREPFGIVYLEAMQAGLPVIASKFGAAPDFVIDGETGYKVDPSDINQIAHCIEKTIGNPRKCRQMGQNGSALVTSHYTWQYAQKKMWERIRDHVCLVPRKCTVQHG